MFIFAKFDEKLRRRCAIGRRQNIAIRQFGDVKVLLIVSYAYWGLICTVLTRNLLNSYGNSQITIKSTWRGPGNLC